jgi:hypothetical protein
MRSHLQVAGRMLKVRLEFRCVEMLDSASEAQARNSPALRKIVAERRSRRLTPVRVKRPLSVDEVAGDGEAIARRQKRRLHRVPDHQTAMAVDPLFHRLGDRACAEVPLHHSAIAEGSVEAAVRPQGGRR